MEKRKVILKCGETTDIAVNELYRKFCMRDLVNYGESPNASMVAERTGFYCDLGMSGKMQKAFKEVRKKGRYDMRWLPDSEWKKFIEECIQSNFNIPKRVLRV